MRVLIDVIDAVGVKRGGTADEPVDLVSLGEKQLGKIRAILPSDACDYGPFCATIHAINPRRINQARVATGSGRLIILIIGQER